MKNNFYYFFVFAVVLVLFVFFESSVNAAKKSNKRNKETEVKKSNTEKPLTETNNTAAAKLLTDEEIKKELATYIQKNIKYEVGFSASSSQQKLKLEGSSSTATSKVTTNIFDFTYAFVAGKYFEPGIGLSYLSSNEQVMTSFKIFCIWNMKNILKETFVPYLHLGVGYSDVYQESNDGTYTGFLLPEFKLGIKLFFSSRAALRLSYQYLSYKLKDSSKDIKFTHLEHGPEAGISIFF